MGTENDLPGISLKDEQRQLQNIIGIAQDNLDRAKESVKKLTDDLEDLRDVYEAQDKEGLALWNNATAQLHENERNIVRCEKARLPQESECSPRTLRVQRHHTGTDLRM